MANEVKILISAVDKASATLNKVQSELKQTGQTGQTSFLGMGKAALGAVGGIAAVGAAVGTAAKFVQGAVDDWANYNEQIRKLSIATGTAPEDLSRLSQAADDVGVSMGAMETAMRLMSKNGITPSIENIAKLSDDLLAIQDPAERSTEMAKKFGRGWAEIAPFILSGGDAIRAGTAAIEDNLVATEESITEARKYKAAVDNLADSWTGLKNVLAQEAMPAATNFIDKLYNFYVETKKAAFAQNELNTAIKLGLIPQEELNKGTFIGAMGQKVYSDELANRAIPIMEEYRQKYKAILPDVAEMILKTKNLGDAVDIMSMKVEASEGTLDAFGQAAADAGDGFSRLGDGIRNAQADYDKFLQGKRALEFEAVLNWRMPDIADQIKSFFDKQKWEAAGGEALEAAFGKVQEAVINGAITQTQAGIVFKQLYLENARIQMALGNWDLEAAAQNIRDTLGVSLAEALTLVNQVRARASFDIDSYLTVHVNYETGTAPGGGGKKNVELDLLPDNLKAKGGPVMANQVYMVGSRGPEIFVPNTSGSIIPNNQIGGVGGGVSIGAINVYAAQGQSTTAIANEVIRKINQSMRAGSRSGLGYTG